MARKKKNVNIKLPPILPIMFCVFLGLFLILNSFYSVSEQEQAVVETLGRPTSTQTSGAHFKIPFIQKVRKISTVTHGMPIGYVEATNETVSEEATMITNDFNFVNADFYIEWRVVDPIKYLYNSNDPQAILKNIAQQCIRTSVGSVGVDYVMTNGKGEVQAKIKEMMISELEPCDIGILVANVTVQDVDPPTNDVVLAFKNVEDAKLGMDIEVNNANEYENSRIPAARADADNIVKKAEATKEARINEANGQVARFNEMFEEYIKNPETTKLRLFYEAMEDIMPDLKVVITDGSAQTILPVDSLADIVINTDRGGN